MCIYIYRWMKIWKDREKQMSANTSREGDRAGLEGSRVGLGSQFFQRSEVPDARRHVATQRSVVVQTAAKTRRSHGPSGRENPACR
jgi:hypothetical protein